MSGFALTPLRWGGLSLRAATAQALNDAFAQSQGKVDVFRAGDPLGTISFTFEAE